MYISHYSTRPLRQRSETKAEMQQREEILFIRVSLFLRLCIGTEITLHALTI
jgi:hypothetical protein